MSLIFLNLAIRFCLEMTVLIAVGMWGWHHNEGWVRYLAAIGMPLVLSTIWGVFNVPDDPTRAGAAPVVVPGLVRFIIEIAFFSVGAWALLSLGHDVVGGIFIVAVVLHHLASLNRIAWLLKR